MKYVSVWLALASPLAAQITLNELVDVNFGDALVTVERNLGEKSFEAERGRAGIDRMIATTSAHLVFDSGKLCRVVLNSGHLMPKPLTPFREAWRNLEPIGGAKLAWPISQKQFEAYFAAWKVRAKETGKEPERDYWIRESDSTSTGLVVSVLFAPRRSLHGTGTLIGDTWTFKFVSAVEARLNPARPAGNLSEIVMTSDEFSTLRRKPTGEIVQRAPRLNGHPLAPIGARGAKLILDNGKIVEIGMPLADAERIFGPSSDNTLPDIIARKGIEREIKTTDAKLTFDQGRLKSVDFTNAYEFTEPIRVFDEPWKNPDSVGSLGITKGMTRRQVDAYLAAWKERAHIAGKKERVDYDVSITDEPYCHLVSVSLAPDRLTLNGRGIWSDSWSLTFDGANEGGALSNLHVMLDAYNTAARPKAGASDPTLTGVTLEDGTELYFGQALEEVEQLTGAKASAVGTGAAAAMSSARSLYLNFHSFQFQNGKLCSIGYSRRESTPAPFRQLWKNLTPIGPLIAYVGMSKDEFMAYFAAWEKRAREGRLERRRDYNVRESKTEHAEALIITMHSGRVSQTGLRMSDTWVVNFTSPEKANQRVNRFDATCGEFTARPPSPATQRSSAVKEAAREMPKLELPKLDLQLPANPKPTFD